MKDFLKEISLFSGLEEEERMQLVGIIEEKRFPKDSIIVYKGQISNELYMIRSGEVKVIVPGKEGHEITLAVLKKGDFFGEMSFFDEEEDQPRSATVITTRESHLLVIERKDFAKLSENFPHVALKILRGVIKRLRRTDEQIVRLSLKE
jgi:CRP/FNR family transcriptional regulator, cyclic AMP receptor protein